MSSLICKATLTVASSVLVDFTLCSSTIKEYVIWQVHSLLDYPDTGADTGNLKGALYQCCFTGAVLPVQSHPLLGHAQF